ncbi:MAG TPA: hypothetical protein VH988_35035 [Thermoanaerobaculia bacterium]|jgi:hypothetical protein|nr:hypothetical protein [Thermoanaerobaculia bacterium]
MQVSNSTGRNTDYRVGASGGGGGSNLSFSGSGSTTSSTATLVGGLLSPGDTELCPNSWPCTVAFMIDGNVVITRDFTEDPGLVALIEAEGGYDLSITPMGDDSSPAA